MNATRPPARHRPWYRIFLWIIPAILLLAMLGGGVWLYFAGRTQAEALIAAELEKRGFSNPRIRLGAFTPGSVRLDAMLGSGIAAEDILIRFTPAALLEGRVDTVEIGNLRIAITIRKDTTPHIDGLPDLAPPSPAAKGGDVPAALPPLPPIAIRQGELKLSAEGYALNGRIRNLSLTPAPQGGMKISAGATAVFSGPVRGRADAILSAHIDDGLERAEIRLKDFAATIRQGKKTLALRMPVISVAIAGDGRLSASGRGRLTAAGWTAQPLPEAEIAFTIAEKAEVALTQPMDKGRITTRLQVDDWRSPARRAALAVRLSDLRIDRLLETLGQPAPRYKITANGDVTATALWPRIEALIAEPRLEALPPVTARLSLAATPRLPLARIRALSLQGDIDARLENGMLDLRAAAPWSARGTLIVPEIRPRPAPFFLQLPIIRTRIPASDLLKKTPDAAITASGRLQAEAANIGKAETAFHLRLPLPDAAANNAGPGMLLPGLDLSLRPFSLRPDAALSLPAKALNSTIGIGGRADGFAISFALNGGWKSRRWQAGLANKASALAVRGRAWLAPGGTLRLFLQDCLSLPPLQLRQNDTQLHIDNGRLCAEKKNQPVLIRTGRGNTNARFLLQGTRLTAATAGLNIAGSLPVVTARLSAGRNGTLKADLKIEGGLLDESTQQIRARAIAASIALQRQNRRLEGRIVLEKLRLEDRARRRRIAPLTFSGAARLQEDTLSGRLTAADNGGNLALHVNFSHDVASGSGQGEYWSKPLRFDGKTYDIAAILPVLAPLITDTRGEADISGRLRWSRKTGIKATGTLAVRGGGGQTSLFAFQGLETISRFSSLWPPRSDGIQDIYLDLLDPGLPLTAGKIRYSLPGNGTLRLERARFNWAGGILAMPPTVIDPASPRHEFVLTAEDISLGNLFQVLAVDGLTGLGRLRGRLPVRIEGDRILIANGVLQSEKGNLRYRPAEGANPLALAGDSPELLARALDDFRYRSLKITLDGELTGKLNIRLSLDGANPQLYDGYPFAVTLSVEAEFATLLRRGLAIYTLPDKIGGRITQKRGRNTQGKKPE